LETETILILLFSVATVVAIGVRQLHVPYTVALVLTGLALGILNLFTPPHLTKELLFSVFLPGLLFEAAFHIEFSEFWRNRLAVVSLAVPGVAVALTTVILPPVLGTLHLEQGFAWPHALVFGALIAATDPIAVSDSRRISGRYRGAGAGDLFFPARPSQSGDLRGVAGRHRRPPVAARIGRTGEDHRRAAIR
jgi:NhaP-type Na+/H+ or K+/H+ antiporter